MNRAGSALLWIAVAVLAVLVFAPQQSIRVDAGQVASNDGFTLLTAQTSDPRASGDRELLYLIDHRSGVLLIYGIQHNERGFTPLLLDGGPMSVLFGTPIRDASP